MFETKTKNRMVVLNRIQRQGGRVSDGGLCVSLLHGEEGNGLTKASEAN